MSRLGPLKEKSQLVFFSHRRKFAKLKVKPAESGGKAAESRRVSAKKPENPLKSTRNSCTKQVHHQYGRFAGGVNALEKDAHVFRLDPVRSRPEENGLHSLHVHVLVSSVRTISRHPSC